MPTVSNYDIPTTVFGTIPLPSLVVPSVRGPVFNAGKPIPCTVQFSAYSDVLFQLDSATVVLSQGQALVSFVKATVASNPNRRVIAAGAEGFASVEGPYQLNVALAAARASAIAILLDKSGALGPAIVTHFGSGPTEQFGRGMDESELRQNRRVVVSLRFNGCS